MEHNRNKIDRPRWTDDSVRRLLSLWDERLSAAQIAAKLGPGFTRNAVVGKLFRLGVRRSDEQRHEDQSRGAQAAGRRQAVMRRGPPMIPVPPAPPRLCSVVPELVRMTELRSTACRWPYGEAEEMRFCGRPKTASGSYCREHHEVAYVGALPPVTLEALEPPAHSRPRRTGDEAGF